MDIGTEIMTFVGNNGFAIAVAWYSLTRLESTIRDNTAVMQNLVIRIGDKSQ